MVTWNINMTFSKIAGGVCILAGLALLILKDGGNAVVALGIGSGLIGVKTVVGQKKG